MKKIKNTASKFSILLFIFVISNLSNVLAIVVQVPTPSGQEDIIVTWPTQIESNESTIFDVIQIVNDYLWFSIAGVAMVVFVFAGIKLIIARWNKEDTSSATRMITSAMIAIIVSILSYAIIRLIINLF